MGSSPLKLLLKRFRVGQQLVEMGYPTYYRLGWPTFLDNTLWPVVTCCHHSKKKRFPSCCQIENHVQKGGWTAGSLWKKLLGKHAVKPCQWRPELTNTKPHRCGLTGTPRRFPRKGTNSVLDFQTNNLTSKYCLPSTVPYNQHNLF